MSLPMSHRIGPASANDLPEVEALLHATQLPVGGLAPLTDTILVSRSRGAIIGCAAVELYGDTALLRSVAVDPGWQGRGLGTELVEKITWLARDRGAHTLFLLTTGAAEYFAALGFAECTRDDAPEAMRASIEFTTLCPSSATVMRRAVEPRRPALRTRRPAPEE
jgi:amino-acid N-acetyltransferase